MIFKKFILSIFKHTELSSFTKEDLITHIMDKSFTYAFLFFLISLVIYRIKSCFITTGKKKGEII